MREEKKRRVKACCWEGLHDNERVTEARKDDDQRRENKGKRKIKATRI